MPYPIPEKNISELIARIDAENESLSVYESACCNNAAYVLSRSTVVYYDSRKGFFKAETFDNAASAYRAAKRYVQ